MYLLFKTFTIRIHKIIDYKAGFITKITRFLNEGLPKYHWIFVFEKICAHVLYTGKKNIVRKPVNMLVSGDGLATYSYHV